MPTPPKKTHYNEMTEQHCQCVFIYSVWVLSLLSSLGNAVVFKNRITLKRIEAAKRIATALAAQVRHQRGMFCLSTPLMGVGERQTI